MGEIQTAHRWMADEAVRDSPRRQYRAHAIAQIRAVSGDPFQGVRFVENLETLLGGGQRHGVRRVGAAVRDTATDLAHDLFAACEHGNGITVPKRLRERAQIGCDVIQLLDAAARHAEPGFDFVDEQNHIVLVA